MKTYQRAKVFSDALRLRILRVLSTASGGLSRGQIAEAVKVPTTSLSHHLKLLLASRVVRRERKKKHSLYFLDRFEYQSLLERLYQIIASPAPPDEDDVDGSR
ncbi:MAG: helix-turn-helix domain-containing protein [bacterium JZ-2024 1]